MRPHLIYGAIALMFAAALWGCGGEQGKCSSGTVLVEGECVVVSPERFCGEGTTLQEGRCVPDDTPSTDAGADANADEDAGPLCLPDCRDRQCGPDGCGGTCGVGCEGTNSPICNTNTGQCQAVCVPDCRGRVCGPDGCGGACGTCDEADDSCTADGHCVPDAWTCDDRLYDALDHCDCDCGVPDPDCQRQGMATLGCDPAFVCREGACENPIPSTWTCGRLQYGDGFYCDCGCGAVDPDCALPDALSTGCAPEEVCGADSMCALCVPDCTNKVCGNDGCGGSCGPECDGPGEVCVGGACVDGCFPTPLLCDTNVCGDDGCGGSCGGCNPGANCADGVCVPEPGKSCAGNCNAQAPAGCSCDPSCETFGDCCPDYDALCVCQPQCDGKVCGPDGCGNECGPCADPNAPFCAPDGASCQAVCAPTCGPENECGDDGCGGTCGTCGSDEVCNPSNLCVPPDWLCFDEAYGDGQACDCACGAPDPDCLVLGNTYGCPSGAACTDQGLCDVSYCGSERDCPGPAWCLGHYPTGDVARKGICENPVASASAPNEACVSDSGCATDLCAAGSCRTHCEADNDCLMGERCVGVGLRDAVQGHALGVVSICDGFTGFAGTCAAHTDCTGPSELCLATIDPVSFEKVQRCGVPAGAGIEGSLCSETEPCSLGLLCVNALCAKPCPGGQTECGTDEVCASVLLHGGASLSVDDDVLADACVFMNP